MSDKDAFIETDVEPDDELGTGLLGLLGYIFRYVVVGEGNVKMKVRRMQVLLWDLRKMGIDTSRCVIIEGKGSDKLFAAEGDELDGEKVPEGQELPVETDYVKCVNDYVHSGGRRFVCIKPARELCEHYDEMGGPAMFGRSTMFSYGSFNIRKIIQVPGDENCFVPEKQELYLRVISGYERTVIHETFPAIGEENAMTIFRCPKTWHFIQESTEPFFVKLRKLVANWNRDLYQKSLKDCLEILKQQGPATLDSAALIDKLDSLPPSGSPEVYEALYKAGFGDPAKKLTPAGERLKRKLKPYQLYRDESVQATSIVFADVGLACMMENPEFDRFLVAGKPGFAKGYLTIDRSVPTSVSRYENISFGNLAATYAKFDDVMFEILSRAAAKKQCQ
jgi:hypothetical protein